ncbi:MAG: ligand-binding protein SH3 [Pseudoxanthomonas suwonensis]|nr:MAG: ligand-binding protein SH3 [Pseudoxanthomonas suwonensis]
MPQHHLASPRIRLLTAALLLGAGLATGSAIAGDAEDARAQNAVRVLRDIQAIPESAIPDKLLDEARAIVVVPDTIKAGLVIGGRRGHGLMAVKTADGTWSNPGFVKLTGGSIGLQAGVQSSDVVLVFRSERGLDSIVNGKFTLGADAAVAAGPLGRNAATATDGQLKAEIWSWSRARGLFAGVALDGAVLSMDDAANEAVYGRDTTPRMVLEGRIAQQPSAAIVDFRDLLEEASATAHARRNSEAAPAAATTAPDAQPATTPAATTAPLNGTPSTPEPKPEPFQPAEPNPAKVEPLPG